MPCPAGTASWNRAFRSGTSEQQMLIRQKKNIRLEKIMHLKYVISELFSDTYTAFLQQK